MSESRPDRRNFLAGLRPGFRGSFGRRSDESGPVSTGPVAGDGPTASAASAPATYLLQVTRCAMACEFAVYLNAGQHPAAAERAVEALDLLEGLEEQLSVYRHHSEVSQMNRRASTEPVSLETRLWQLLEHSQTLFRETDGAFDITAAPLSQVWGFCQRAGRVPTHDELKEALRRTGGRHLCLDAAAQSAYFSQSGLEVNLGAIGKGYALDRCAAHLVHHGVRDFLIHGGHSSVLAMGSRAGRASAGWPIDLRHPLRPDRRLAEIYLCDRALGTSSTATQGFYHDGRRYGHIIDPRTGEPCDSVLSSTVLAADAATADALATAFFVMGPDCAREFCQARPDLSALLVVPGPQGHGYRILDVNLPAEQWRCLDPEAWERGAGPAVE